MMAVMPGQVVAETPRLCLHAMSDRNDDDAALMLALLNDPGFIRHIADRGVRSEDDARAYLATGPAASYAKHGHGRPIDRERRGQHGHRRLLGRDRRGQHGHGQRKGASNPGECARQ